LGLFLKDCERLKDGVLSSEIIKKKDMRFTAVSMKLGWVRFQGRKKADSKVGRSSFILSSEGWLLN
jgi:hypothetical protein